jgi:hypothetical protein
MKVADIVVPIEPLVIHTEFIIGGFMTLVVVVSMIVLIHIWRHHDDD